MDRVLVEDDGTGRRTLEVEGFSLSVLVVSSLGALLSIEWVRL